MERGFVKLIRLLALTSWSEKELHEIIRVVGTMPPSVFLEFVKSSREELAGDLPRGIKRGPRSRYYDPSLDKAYDLLMELPISATSAARKLKRIIIDHHTGVPIRDMRSKEGVRAWLEHVAEVLGASELLHFCNMLREQLVETDRGPWSLRGDTSS